MAGRKEKERKIYKKKDKEKAAIPGDRSPRLVSLCSLVYIAGFISLSPFGFWLLTIF